MEKHVYSILARNFKKEKKDPNLTHYTSTSIKHSQTYVHMCMLNEYEEV